MRLVALLVALFWAAPAEAHLGSPDIFFDAGGPYGLFVTIRPPEVLPGIAQVEIQSSGPAPRSVRVAPLRLTGPGSEHAPPAEELDRARDVEGYFTGGLFLLEAGSLQMRIEADGDAGAWSGSVPFPSVATKTKAFTGAIAVFLALLTGLLSLGAVLIAAAAAREAQLPEGAAPGSDEFRRGRIAMAAAAVTVAGLLAFGARWWDVSLMRLEDGVLYDRRPLTLELEGERLKLTVGQSSWSDPRQPFERLIPDHGHLMHLFLVRWPEMDRVFHLHPRLIEEGYEPVFAHELPALPTGNYRAFADIVDQSGFPETLSADIALPALKGAPLTGDDSTSTARPQGAAAPSLVAPLGGGYRMAWRRESRALKARRPERLHFLVEDEKGRPANDLVPYMGMAGHAVFLSADGGVFAHIHPSGSVSMPALQLAQREADPHAGHVQASALPAEVSFPYGFPKAGRYRVFVQVRRRTVGVVTGAFDAEVAP